MMGVPEAGVALALFEEILPRVCAQERGELAFSRLAVRRASLPFQSDKGVRIITASAYRRLLGTRSALTFASPANAWFRKRP